MLFFFVFLRQGFTTYSRLALNFLCSLSWPQTCKHPASASGELGLQVCAHHIWQKIILLCSVISVPLLSLLFPLEL